MHGVGLTSRKKLNYFRECHSVPCLCLRVLGVVGHKEARPRGRGRALRSSRPALEGGGFVGLDRLLGFPDRHPEGASEVRAVDGFHRLSLSDGEAKGESLLLLAEGEGVAEGGEGFGVVHNDDECKDEPPAVKHIDEKRLNFFMSVFGHYHRVHR